MSAFSIKEKAVNDIVYKIVCKDQIEIGLVGEDGKFTPSLDVHHKTVEAAEKWLKSQSVEPPKAKESPEPPRTERGDIDPALIEWRRQNWPKADFDNLYPESRLRQIK